MTYGCISPHFSGLLRCFVFGIVIAYCVRVVITLLVISNDYLVALESLRFRQCGATIAVEKAVCT